MYKSSTAAAFSPISLPTGIHNGAPRKGAPSSSSKKSSSHSRGPEAEVAVDDGERCRSRLLALPSPNPFGCRGSPAAQQWIGVEPCTATHHSPRLKGGNQTHRGPLTPSPGLIGDHLDSSKQCRRGLLPPTSFLSGLPGDHWKRYGVPNIE